VAVKSVVTIDHISDGRAMLGIGGAWFETEHDAFGIEFGSGFGQRLDWLAEAVPAARALLDGRTVTSDPGGRYAFDGLRILPAPVQAHLPIMIGGAGERKTLRSVARWADMWNASGTPEVMAAKDAILRQHCEAVGRDEATIERTLGCTVTIRSTVAEAKAVLDEALDHNRRPRSSPVPDDTYWIGTASMIAERMLRYLRVGIGTFVVELPAPYDLETMETLMTVVKPMVESAS
jgi:alkanesulfonate monooxygenase SsuD/methylene tetrahydromethanopterin reductase-like flavin-dependent oxidoreductase (luciferase family)